MKRVFAFALCILMGFNMHGQVIEGQWNGVLNFQGIEMRIVFHIEKTGDGYTGTMDSPDQGATGIPISSITYHSPEIQIAIDNLRIEYKGTLTDSIIQGTFIQASVSIPMDLTRRVTEKIVIRKPQDPKQPYPYLSEDITFTNQSAGVVLAGTFTKPSKPGKYPVVILISGSGPQDRNEELLGHKPFLVLSDYLTRKGIAVLRYDDRGTGQSGGDFNAATTYDLADDAAAAVEWLKNRQEVDPSRIGLIGHSEGGIIAPMVANRMKDVAFIVLLAGTGIPGDRLLLMQGELIARAGGATEEQIQADKATNAALFEIIRTTRNPVELAEKVTLFLKKLIIKRPELLSSTGLTEEQFIAMQLTSITSPWMQTFLKLDPSKELEQVTCPVLALNGSLDLQVPPKENLTAIRQALNKGGNHRVTIKEYPKLNHLFQEAKTGHPSEYGEIKQTFSPKVMKDISKWVLKLK
jgi:uncharacterized protein